MTEIDLTNPLGVVQRVKEMDDTGRKLLAPVIRRTLETDAQALADAKREADAADEAYKAARKAADAAFEREHASIIERRKTAQDTLNAADTRARLLVEAYGLTYGDTGKLIDGQYTIERHAAPRIDDKRAFVRYIVTQLPALADTLLMPDEKAVTAFVTKISEADTDDESGLPIRRLWTEFQGLPIHMGVQLKPRIEWKVIEAKHPVVEAVALADLAAAGTIPPADSVTSVTPVAPLADFMVDLLAAKHARQAAADFPRMLSSDVTE